MFYFPLCSSRYVEALQACLWLIRRSGYSRSIRGSRSRCEIRSLAAGRARVAVIGRLHAHQGNWQGPTRRGSQHMCLVRPVGEPATRLLHVVLPASRGLQAGLRLLRVVVGRCSG